MRSMVGCSHQSNSPAFIAAALVAGSGETVHSTRSKFTVFGPDVYSAGPSERGT